MTRRGPIVGRLSAALGAAVLFSTTSAGASAVAAGPSTHVQEHVVSVVGIPIMGPGASAYLQASHSSLSGSEAGLALWIEPELPWTGPPTYTSGGANLSVGAGDSSLGGTFDILDSNGAVAGIGVLDASLTPAGEPHEVTWPKSGGNHKHRESQVIQEMLVSGSVTVTIGAQQIVLSLDGATGSAADYTAFKNDPAASVDWDTYTVLSFTETVDDTVLQLLMREDGGTAITEVVVQTPGEIFTSLDDGSGTTFSGSRYGLELALQPSGGGGQGIGATSASSGTISGSATVNPAERYSWSDRYEGSTLRLAVQTYTVSGSFTVAFDDGTTRTFTMNDGNAYAEQVTFRAFQPAG